MNELSFRIDNLYLTISLGDLIERKKGTHEFAVATRLMTHRPVNRDAFF